jgi:hypothetical protein
MNRKYNIFENNGHNANTTEWLPKPGSYVWAATTD